MARPMGKPDRVISIEDRGGEGSTRYRVHYVRNGVRTPVFVGFGSKDLAEKWCAAFEWDLQVIKGPTVEALMRMWADQQELLGAWRKREGRKGTRSTTLCKLAQFFGKDVLLAEAHSVSSSRLKERYRIRCEAKAVRTSNEALKAARQFWDWTVKEKYRRTSPVEDLELRRGARTGADRLHLTNDQMDRFRFTAIQGAAAGDEEAVLALAACDLGLRATEYIITNNGTPVPTDWVDSGGTVFWYDDAKSGRHLSIEVEDPLAGFLAQLAARHPGQPLWSHRGCDWTRACVEKYCEIAGVPTITAQQMRASHDEDALDEIIEVIAGKRHNKRTTKHDYLTKRLQRRAKQALRMARLAGDETDGNCSLAKSAAESVEVSDGYTGVA
ncbi:MAG: hypothetical protein V2A73_14310 [Pseudomonadota bacterium]